MQGFVFSPEVAEARSRGAAIVALESTIIAHGFGYPANLELARELENEVRQYGAVPATIAVVAGVVQVGVDDAVLEKIAREGASFRKAGATDLGVYVARGSNAATTVSATAVCIVAAMVIFRMIWLRSRARPSRLFQLALKLFWICPKPSKR